MGAPALNNSPRLLALVEDLQGRGRYSFTLAEVTTAAGERSAVAVEAALRRLRARGRIATPRRGFHVIVPAEYRTAGCPPASWFIEDLMRFLGQPYYVGLLSAAALHGAAHQQPMAFQVITDRPTRPALAGRVRIVFHMSRSVVQMPVMAVQTETGSMRVSTPEGTALDLVRFASAAGQIGNVATVITELAEKISGDALVQLAPGFALPDVQRLGYLLDLAGEHERADPLARWLTSRRVRPTALGRGQRGKRIRPDARWRVIANVAVKADV